MYNQPTTDEKIALLEKIARKPRDTTYFITISTPPNEQFVYRYLNQLGCFIYNESGNQIVMLSRAGEQYYKMLLSEYDE